MRCCYCIVHSDCIGQLLSFTNFGVCIMKALSDLFSTDYGMMSFIVIAAIVVVSVGAYVVLQKKMDESASSSKK